MMTIANLEVFLMTVAVAVVVLAGACTALFFLNKAVDQADQ